MRIIGLLAGAEVVCLLLSFCLEASSVRRIIAQDRNAAKNATIIAVIPGREEDNSISVLNYSNTSTNKQHDTKKTTSGVAVW